jgi:rhamnosyltransferase
MDANLVTKNTLAVVIPTLNAGDSWNAWLAAFGSQSCSVDYVLVVDSSSTDQTAILAEKSGYDVLTIQRQEFNHGTTRQLAADNFASADIIVYMTQDALLADADAVRNLVAAFDDLQVGAAYGRQLPHKDAKPIGAHARLYNYPDISAVRSSSDIARLGLKAAFLSNSFSAYRKSALLAVGGFPANNIFGEDAYVASKMILSGWKIAYMANAKVYHSHDYSMVQEFKRYFDIGVFHAHEPWLRSEFGGAEGEGKKFVISELKYLLKSAPWLIPSAMARTGLKYMGYRLGMLEKKMPASLKYKLSMHKRFWL